MSDEGFLDWCHRRARYGNKKSQEIRTSKAAERAMEIKTYIAAHPELSNRAVAAIFAVDEKTVRNAKKLVETADFTYIR